MVTNVGAEKSGADKSKEVYTSRHARTGALVTGRQALVLSLLNGYIIWSAQGVEGLNVLFLFFLFLVAAGVSLLLLLLCAAFHVAGERKLQTALERYAPEASESARRAFRGPMALAFAALVAQILALLLASILQHFTLPHAIMQGVTLLLLVAYVIRHPAAQRRLEHEWPQESQRAGEGTSTCGAPTPAG